MQSFFFIAFIFAAFFGISVSDFSGRIVGGDDAPEGKYPYQVSLQKRSHFCGGSILNKRWILTAAHCLAGQSAADIKILTGTNLLDKGGRTYQADLIVSNPHYIPLLIINDIGLIRVNEDITFSDKVQPVKLPKSDFAQPDDKVILSGWGKTSLGGHVPNSLQHIDLKIVSKKSCRRTHLIIMNSHICTLTKAGEGACHGDSGGPLVAGDTQVGVVSFGRPCGRGYPDVFTRVWAFVDWINETIVKNS